MLCINIGFILCYFALLAPQAAHSKAVRAINSQPSDAPICSLHGNEVIKIITDPHSMNIVGKDASFDAFADEFLSDDADLHGMKSKKFWLVSAPDKSGDKATKLVENVNTQDRVVEGENEKDNFGGDKNNFADKNDANLNDEDDHDSNLSDGDDDVSDNPAAALALVKLLGLAFGVSRKDEPDSVNEARLRRRLEEEDNGYNYKLCKSEPTVERRFDKFPYIKINWSCKKNSRLIKNLDFSCVPIYETRPILKIADGCLSFGSRSEEVWVHSTETVATGCQALLNFDKPS